MLQPAMFVVNVQVALRCNDQLLVIGRSEDEAHAGGALDIPGGRSTPLNSVPLSWRRLPEGRCLRRLAFLLKPACATFAVRPSARKTDIP